MGLNEAPGARSRALVTIIAELGPWSGPGGAPHTMDREGEPAKIAAIYGRASAYGDQRGVVAVEDWDGCRAPLISVGNVEIGGIDPDRHALLEELASGVQSMLELPIEIPTELADEFEPRFQRVGRTLGLLGMLPDGPDQRADQASAMQGPRPEPIPTTPEEAEALKAALDG